MPIPFVRNGWQLTTTVVLLVALLTCVRPGSAADGGSAYPQVVRVSKTFDGKPFEYRVESGVRRQGHSMYRLSYPSPLVTAVPQNNTIPAEYYLPEGIPPGAAPRPAVICMHILDGNMELVRMTASVLASHGVPAILFKLPYYGERGLAEGPEAMARDPKMFVSAISQAMLDVRRTVDLLASRPEVSPERIGITGISLGGIVAATAAECEPRLSRAMLILAGGDLMTIIHHARETRDLSALIRGLQPAEQAAVVQAIRSVDPLGQAERLRERARAGLVLMVNAAEDEVIPPECTRKLAQALGIAERVDWLSGLGHYTAMAALPRILQDMVTFFAQDLPPGVKAEAKAAPVRSPTQIVLGLVQQAMGLLTAEPAEGRGHLIDVEVSATPQGQKAMAGRLRIARGAAGKFQLECRAPVIGEVAIGQGRYPWMASGKKVVFQGTKGGGKPSDPLALADPEYLLRLRMIGGALAGAAMAPEILDPWVAIQEAPPQDGHPAIRLTAKGRTQGSAVLLLKDDKATPLEIAFDVPGVKGSVKFHAWEMNTVAPEAMFAPPAAAATKEVEPAELYRIFSAMFNFAMESIR